MDYTDHDTVHRPKVTADLKKKMAKKYDGSQDYGGAMRMNRSIQSIQI